MPSSTRGDVHEIDRLVVHLAFAELDQPLDETAQPKRFDVGRGPDGIDRLRHVLHVTASLVATAEAIPVLD